MNLATFTDQSNIELKINNIIKETNVVFDSTWVEYKDDCPGKVEYLTDGSGIHNIRTGCGGNGGATGIYKEGFNISVDDNTSVTMSIKIVSYDLSNGGYYDHEYPANLDLGIIKEDGSKVTLEFAFTYDANDHIHTEGTNYIEVITKIPKNEWTTKTFNIKKYVSDAKSIYQIAYLGKGWDYESYVKDVKFGSSTININDNTSTTSTNTNITPATFVTDIIYQTYKTIKDKTFDSDFMNYCDIFIDAKNLPDIVKFNDQELINISKEGIYGFFKIPLNNVNTLKTNNNFLIITYPDTFTNLT